MPSILRLISRAVLLLMFVVLAGGFSRLYAVYTNPTDDPPLANRAAPVNLDDDFQDVVGGIQANAIGVTYGVSLPPGPNGGEKTVSEIQQLINNPTDTANCHLEVRRVNWSGGGRTFESDTGTSLGQYPTCNDYLIDSAKTTDYWAPTGADNCLGTDGVDCITAAPESTCVYTRLVCPTGITVVQPLFSTSTYSGGSISLPVNSLSSNPL